MKKDQRKPVRLPRKLKKDIIKVSGRESYYRVVRFMIYKYIKTGNQYLKIKKSNG